MTIITWAHYIKDRISRIDKERIIDIREAKQAMNQSFNQLLYEASKADSNLLFDYYAREYTDQSVTLNATTDRYETLFPATLVQLPGKKLQKSIRNVNTDQGDDLDFVPITEEEYYYYKGQDADLEDNIILYYTQRDRMVFLKGVDETSEILTTGIRVKMLVALENYDDTDEVPVPDNRDIDFLNMCLQYLGITQPVDLKDDN